MEKTYKNDKTMAVLHSLEQKKEKEHKCYRKTIVSMVVTGASLIVLQNGLPEIIGEIIGIPVAIVGGGYSMYNATQADRANFDYVKILGFNKEIVEYSKFSRYYNDVIYK